MSVDALPGIADPTRRHIVERLSSGGLAVTEIAADLPMSRPAVSKHLRVLREHGLVVETRVGRQRIYELVAQPLEEIVAWLEELAEGPGPRRDPAIERDRGELAAASAGAPGERAGRPAASRPRPPDLEDDVEDRWRSW